MFEHLIEKLGIGSDRPPTDDEVVAGIDLYLRGEFELSRMESRNERKKYTDTELRLVQDAVGTDRFNLGSLLEDLGLWHPEGNKRMISTDEVRRIRAELAPIDETQYDNVVKIRRD